ncbi:Polyphosphate kinase (EC [Olavius algarvensis Delta 1 endosymbiont]|nr:Polyphosphate kinase (EC [Olavius algarvensis Delta 1 endosymbiont]
MISSGFSAIYPICLNGFQVQGSGFRVPGSGFRVPGSGFKVQGSEVTTDAYYSSF